MDKKVFFEYIPFKKNACLEMMLFVFMMSGLGGSSWVEENNKQVQQLCEWDYEWD